MSNRAATKLLGNCIPLASRLFKIRLKAFIYNSKLPLKELIVVLINCFDNINSLLNPWAQYRFLRVIYNIYGFLIELVCNSGPSSKDNLIREVALLAFSSSSANFSVLFLYISELV